VKRAKTTISGIRGIDGESLLPVYVAKRGAPRGNRNGQRGGHLNREARAQRARLSAVLKKARSGIVEAREFLREERAARVCAQNPRLPCPNPPNSI
jgi:hypothetical protein